MKCYNLDSRIRSALRKVFWYWPVRLTVHKNAKMVGGYKCNKCQKVYDKVMIDHINPVVDVKKGFQNWDVYIKRMFCNATNLQPLCKECHRVKTKKEKRKRMSSS